MAGDKWSWNGTFRRQFIINEKWTFKGAYLILNLLSLEVVGMYSILLKDSNQVKSKLVDLSLDLPFLYVRLEIKPCGLGSRIRDVGAF